MYCIVSFQDDIGLGSVVGSAVFNIMLVISVCALFAGAVRIKFYIFGMYQVIAARMKIGFN